jgi:hypothetical protein
MDKPRSNDVAGTPAPPPAPQQAQLPFPAPRRAPHLWLRRLSRMLYVLVSLVLGMILVQAPWQSGWSSSPLLWTAPRLQAFLALGFVRGVVSGLGIVDLWLGVRAAVSYKEDSGR